MPAATWQLVSPLLGRLTAVVGMVQKLQTSPGVV
ncbi:hypothetical protein GMORB2_2669 [Geosmithia morbida]|uniref:Uncharacterized protein n=1 Tax=Geosmithia morbida TaxID=1094350 RepID=A0A9P4YPD0_9HYPO|nr:uncharacterized protein GMORB2_2669 [Geosmithia morbida]KAF4120666.1 hypothetical protein GMORB2_2669 [Geosmithia morbida]